MNNKKSPELLSKLAQHQFCSMIGCRVIAWTDKLLSTGGLGWRDRLPLIHAVLNQCLELRHLLISQPDSTGRLISEPTFRTVADIIAKYDIAFRSRFSNMIFRRQYEEVCLYLLRAVYVPCMEKCNIKDTGSEFVQDLLSQSLQINLNVTCLILPLTLSNKASRSILRNLHRLTVLQEFRSKFCCTTDILIELGKHCTLLRVLDVTSSTFVTDGCVGYLLNLKSLEELYVGGTKISEIRYAFLLSFLPRIRNIHWRGPVEGILKNIALECLPLVTEFCGTVSDASIVAKVCPRIKNLKISLLNQNSLELKQLTDVVSLEVGDCDYKINNLSIIFKIMGVRLRELHMFMVRNINFSHVIRGCPVLKILILKFCGVTISENAIFDPELPHFKSVNEMTLQGNQDLKNVHKYLHHYVNLKVFRAEFVGELEDVTVSAILNAGGFRKLSELVFRSCGFITLRTAMLLIEKCGSLSVLGNLNTWSGVSDHDKKKLFDFVKTNNLVLNVKLE
jgi:hypothetical protein